jgi:hypothetical protein
VARWKWAEARHTSPHSAASDGDDDDVAVGGGGGGGGGGGDEFAMRGEDAFVISRSPYVYMFGVGLVGAEGRKSVSLTTTKKK